MPAVNSATYTRPRPFSYLRWLTDNIGTLTDLAAYSHLSAMPRSIRRYFLDPPRHPTRYDHAAPLPYVPARDIPEAYGWAHQHFDELNRMLPALAQEFTTAYTELVNSTGHVTRRTRFTQYRRCRNALLRLNTCLADLQYNRSTRTQLENAVATVPQILDIPWNTPQVPF